jgi:hypothetical protein
LTLPLIFFWHFKNKETCGKEMKLLAIEKELKTVDWENESQTPIEKAKSAYKGMLSDNLREIYFTESENAVLLRRSCS